MEYTEELTLISLAPTTDDIGNTTFTETQNTVLARKNVVGTKEFYSAMAVGITPTAEMQIRLSNYNDEQEAIYKSKRYSIIRTIPKGKFDVVLVLGIKNGTMNG